MTQQTNTQPSDLPKDIRLFLFSSDTFAFLEKQLVQAGVAQPDVSPLSAAVYFLAKGERSPDEFLTTIQETYKLDAAKATSVALVIGSDVLMPHEDRLPVSIDDMVKAWGGLTISDEPIDPTRYVKAYVSQIDGLEPRRLDHRLELFLLSYIHQQLNRDQIKEKLTHALKVGGLGLSDDVAERVLREFDEDKQQRTFNIEQPKQPAKPKVSSKKQMKEQKVQSSQPSQTVDNQEQDEEGLAKEIQSIQKEKEHILGKKGPLDVPAVVDEICKQDIFSFDDPNLTNRCRKLVESRVRGVRNAMATREQLERPIEKGGMGLKGRNLADTLQVLEERVDAYQKQIKDQQQKQRAQKQSSSSQTAQEREKKETQLMSKRYVELTGKMPKERVAPVSPPSTRVSAAISAHHEQQQRESKIDGEKVRQVVQASQAKPSTKPSSKPTMAEVTFAKKLAGPVDELRMMNLVEFRRLAKDPAEAIVRVCDKVHLLQEQGYEKKIEAIQAWRSSPLHVRYMDLTRQAVLTGVSVFELLQQRRTSGEDVFTDEELRSIMKLNDTLRF